MPYINLSSRERVLLAIDHKPTDVVPVGPFMFDLAAVHCGINVGEFCTSPGAMADAQLALYETLGQDIIFIGSDNYYIAEGFGCTTAIPGDEISHMESPAVASIANVYGLEVPNPLTDGRMPVMIEATRLVKQALGDSVAIRTPGTGPFALASYFVGTQEFLIEVGYAHRNNPSANQTALHHALNLAADALIAFGKACFDAGADILHCGDSLSSCDMISPEQYETWAFPYQKKVIQAWKAYGAKTLLHICGDATQVLPLYASTGADIVELDSKVDLAYAKQIIGDKTCILGNVDTVTTLLQGTPTKVRHDSEQCIAAASFGGGYILGSGCMMPRHTPIENIQAMIETARSFTNDMQ
jgi:uroporphyrinogen decarboxylase